MRIVFYSGLLGVAGVVSLIAVHFVAHSQGFMTTPSIYQLLTAGCWFSVVVGVLGAIGGLFARMRSASRNATTFIISLCVGVALLAIWTRGTALPHYILWSGERFPMQVGETPR